MANETCGKCGGYIEGETDPCSCRAKLEAIFIELLQEKARLEEENRRLQNELDAARDPWAGSIGFSDD